MLQIFKCTKSQSIFLNNASLDDDDDDMGRVKNKRTIILHDMGPYSTGRLSTLYRSYVIIWWVYPSNQIKKIYISKRKKIERDT